MKNPNTSLEDKETTHRSSFFRSYREFLDAKNPFSVATSERFYTVISSKSQAVELDRLKSCRTESWFVFQAETGAVRLASKQCHLRWCYHCSEARQQFITHAVTPWYRGAKDPKLLTVTLKHSTKPLKDQIDHLYKSFAKLRNRKLLKKAIRGGVWFFQVTHNEQTDTWHPHIHALIDGLWISHTKLKNLWYKITHTSTIVHIRQVTDPDKTVAHNARYAARPTCLEKIPEHHWQELYDAFAGRRIVGTWKSAKKISLRPKKPDDAAKWKAIGSWRIVRELIDTDENAKAIWKAWSMGTPLEDGISLNDCENFIAGKEDYEPPPKDWNVNPYFNWSSYDN